MDLDQIQQLVDKQENDWKVVTGLQIKSLQTALDFEKEKSSSLEAQFSQLKEDFKYNLKLLHERDKELQVLDASNQRLKASEGCFLSEISDLKIQLDRVEQQYTSADESKREADIFYKKRLHECQTQMHLFQADKEKVVSELTSELGKVKRELEAVRTQLQGELESQKLELTHEFEDMMALDKKRLHEKEDEVKRKCFNLEMKNKILQTEVDIANDRDMKSCGQLKTTNLLVEELQTKIQQLEWDLSDSSNMKNQRILELERQIEEAKEKAKKKELEFDERRKQLDQDIRGKQANLISTKESYLDRERSLEDQIRKLESKVETCEMETKRTLWEANEQKNKYQSNMKSKITEMENTKIRLKGNVDHLQKSQLAKEAEILTMRQQQDILKAEKKKLVDELQILREDLIKARTRANMLEKSHEFEGNIRFVDDLNDQNFKSSVGGKSVDSKVATDPQASRDITELEQQNKQLKEVIKQMSETMKDLIPQQQQTSSNKEVTSDSKDSYVKSLEAEIFELKQAKRRLENEQQNKASSANREVDSEVLISNNHPTLRQHIESLNKKIVAVESEKVDLTAKLMKLQSKFDHQLEITTRSEQQISRITNKLQQVELEATSSRHRFEHIQNRNEKRIAELNQQLEEAQKEADEYYRGGVMQSLRTIELNGQISEMKVDAASGTKWLKDHNQAKVVHELRADVKRLERKLAMSNIQTNLLNTGDGNGNLISLMKEKLISTTNEISSLRDANKLLLESSNRLRSQLNRHREGNFKLDDEEQEVKENKMKKLQNLQYELTKRELEFAQRQNMMKENTNLASSLPTSNKKGTGVDENRNLTMTSSIHSDSMNEIWKVLDDIPSNPSTFVAPVHNEDPPVPTPSMAVTGKPLTKAKMMKKKKKPKVRNYNVKDDNIFQTRWK